MTAEETSHCAVLAAWLRAMARLGPWSLLLSAVGVIGWFGLEPDASMSAALVLVLVLGVAQRYLQVRLVLDQALFEALGSGRIPGLAEVDSGLHAIGLRAAPGKARSLSDRTAGTQRLVRTQFIVVLVQTLALAWVLANV